MEGQSPNHEQEKEQTNSQEWKITNVFTLTQEEEQEMTAAMETGQVFVLKRQLDKNKQLPELTEIDKEQPAQSKFQYMTTEGCPLTAKKRKRYYMDDAVFTTPTIKIALSEEEEQEMTAARDTERVVVHKRQLDKNTQLQEITEIDKEQPAESGFQYMTTEGCPLTAKKRKRYYMDDAVFTTPTIKIALSEEEPQLPLRIPPVA